MRESLSLRHSLFLFLSLALYASFRSIAHGRFWDISTGFRLSTRAVLLRLVAGPVTNRDSSARERRGHTTLGSGSGACCHPLRVPPSFQRRQPWLTPPGTAGEPPSRAIIALRNKERGAGGFEGPGCSCRCLIFATGLFVRFSRFASSFCLLFLSTSSNALGYI